MERFSIIIPTYNYGHYLADAIESAFSQPGDDYEVVVVDDESTDGTFDVVKPYLNRIRYSHQSNQGQSAARNRGAAAANGEYFLFLDADDRLMPGALQAFRGLLGTYPQTEMAFGGYISVSWDGTQKKRIPKTVGPNNSSNFRDYINRRFSIANGAAIVHRRIFQTVQYPESLRTYEDVVFYGQILARFQCRSFPEPVLEVRAHEGRSRNNFALIQGSGDRVVDLLFDDGVLPDSFMDLRGEFLSTHLLEMFRSYYLAGRYQEANALYREAVWARPRNLLQWAYTRKYLRSAWKALRRQPARDLGEEAVLAERGAEHTDSNQPLATRGSLG